jgi:Tfp pilus assembly protein PilF
MGWGILGLLVAGPLAGLGQTAGGTTDAQVVEVEHTVQYEPPGGAWADAAVGQALPVHYRLKTGTLSRAAVKLTDLSVLRLDELTTIEIEPPQVTTDKPTLDVKAGLMYMFSREKPEDLDIHTPVATGALRGTEFAVRVGANGRTTLAMFDGEVEVSNALGSVTVRSGEEADVEPGHAPVKTAVIEARNIIQWCLYYPGVVDAKELHLSPQERGRLGKSLAAYEAGDLLGALDAYPAGEAATPAGHVYRAAVLLAVGRVDGARAELTQAKGADGAEALEEMIAAVNFETYTRKKAALTAGDWMAESYYAQSRSDLEGALKAALRAAQAGPEFGFAWERVAELEFGFGRTERALNALEHGLRLAPRNAQAAALRGFLLSAENKTGPAREAFNEAIQLDGALGNAWLGRGLCSIRAGKAEAGRVDLQIAAALEPNRSLLRSYLGKALSNAGNATKARMEFTRAETLDPHDPTPWLYSALENKMDNRINDAVADLENSLKLNDNRRVYRSQFLLDQDRAVRSANLAAIYEADGMDEVAVREATRAVTDDYASASAHLFLANSYNNLRDPTRINLQYETPWYNELLLSFLLSPVGGGPLSEYVSEQEYSKLFESDRAGISTSTDYFSTGIIDEIASQYGTFGNFSYSLDTQYLDSRGTRPNNRLSLSESSGQFKLQLGPQDTMFFRIEFEDTRNGDTTDRYDQTAFVPDLHVTETQSPGIVLIGYHHEWGPGVHTLLLLGRLQDHISQGDTGGEDVLLANPMRELVDLQHANFLTKYESNFLVYTAELQQIFETPGNTLVAGARYQVGSFDTQDELNLSGTATPASFFPMPPASGAYKTDFERMSAYAYDTIKPADWVSLTLGASYDYMLYPRDYRSVPVYGGSTTVYRFSPKAGFTLTPFSGTLLQGAYTRSLGGASFDESVLLEPTEIDGFPQVFRTVIPESVVGSVSAPKYETEGIGLQQKIGGKTYFGVNFTNIYEQVRESTGVFEQTLQPVAFGQPTLFPGSTPEKLSYDQRTLISTLNQLIGRDWSVGARDSLSYSELRDTLEAIPSSPAAPREKQEGLFNQLQLFATYNHPSGFFARGEADWFNQRSYGYTPSLHGDDFWQYNIFAGYRLRRNMGEISLGVLNLADQDYAINPLNSFYTPIDFYDTLARKRTLLVRVRLNF